MRDIRICFVGDSFVNGAGDTEFLGWVGRVCTDAARKGHELTSYNLGIRRNTSRDILKRWQEIDARYQKRADNRIVLSFGVNDTVIENGKPRVNNQVALENIRQILSLVKEVTCLVIGPPPIADSMQNQSIQRYSQMLETEANRLGIPFIELYSALVKDTDYLQEVSENDQAHPKSFGYEKMARIIINHPNWWF